MGKIFDEEFWTDRYKTGNTGWDIGEVSTPLKEYIDQLEDKSIRILIPGCGNAYEAKYLFDNGFLNVDLVDLSNLPLEKFRQENPEFPRSQLIHGDFFDLKGPYDLIFEQTFFCALEPNQRPAYVHKMNELLAEEGKLVGVLFDDPLFDDHPPFGGNKEEYSKHFIPLLDVKVLETCTNSVPPRTGRELFIIAGKK